MKYIVIMATQISINCINVRFVLHEKKDVSVECKFTYISVCPAMSSSSTSKGKARGRPKGSRSKASKVAQKWMDQNLSAASTLAALESRYKQSF